MRLVAACAAMLCMVPAVNAAGERGVFHATHLRKAALGTAGLLNLNGLIDDDVSLPAGEGTVLLVA